MVAIIRCPGQGAMTLPLLECVKQLNVIEIDKDLITMLNNLNKDNLIPRLILPVPARLSAVPWSTEVRIKGKPKVILTAFLKPKVFNTKV
jgi:16S rRNA (adenine1518-N6/adenine1519-N6)-dimethyltransferase